MNVHRLYALNVCDCLIAERPAPKPVLANALFNEHAGRRPFVK